MDACRVALRVGSNCAARDDYARLVSLLRRGLAIATTAAAVIYVVIAIGAIWRTPDIGFRVRIGRYVASARADSPVHVGDRVLAIDGEAVQSTMAYARWRRTVSAGERLLITVANPQGVQRQVSIVAAPGSVPVLGLITASFGVVLLLFGLAMRLRDLDSGMAYRFWVMAVPFPLIYVGAIAAPFSLPDPVVIGGLALALAVSPALLDDFFATVPMPIARSSRVTRAALIVTGVVFAVLTMFGINGAEDDDSLLRAAVGGLLVMGLSNIVMCAIGLRRQWRRARVADATERAQLKWMLGGFALVVVHTAVIAPGALSDPLWFTVGGFVPLLCGAAILWFGAAMLAVLRVRLTTIDAVVPSSLLYSAAARGSMVAAALAVIAVGTIAHQLADGAPTVAAAATAIAAAILFGPVRARVQSWFDTWSGRDRGHYLAEVHRVMHQLLPLREESAAAKVALEKAVEIVAATGGAIYLRGERIHSCGHGEYPDVAPADETTAERLVCTVERNAVLVLGRRRGGDPYREDDRHLLAAVTVGLAAALDASHSSRELAELRARNSAPVIAPIETSAPPLVGESAVATKLRTRVAQMAASAAPVLLTGETGVGKGVISRELHRRSERAGGPFVHVDCASIPAALVESELFGHERGAFTGADKSRKGLLELASGGTVFLDEIGELPLALQPKLLRALQERTIRPVGATRSRDIDIRVIAATNRNLEEMIRAGTFREDLYFRLRVLELEIPPLRDRRADIAAIAASLLPRLAERNGGAQLSLATDAITVLAEHDWPGNIRELENTLERAIVLGGVTTIHASSLVVTARRKVDVPAVVDAADHREYLEVVERERLIAALDAAGGNRAEAARRLGLPRTTLVNKLRRYGITS
jgi:DNA-binding NtrC family response regulator